MAVEHSTLTTTDLHEPKGVAAAVADQLYIADGAASGTWTDADNNIYLFGTIDDISTAASFWIPSPCTGIISKIHSIINGAIADADAVLTFEIGGVLITDGSSNNLTITQSGSAAGDVDTMTPTGANTLAIGDKIELITDGGSTNTIISQIVLTVTPT
jgi:hypothetical protein